MGSRNRRNPIHRRPYRYQARKYLTEKKINGESPRNFHDRFAVIAHSLYIALMSSIRPWRDIARRPSRQIMVGDVAVGGDAPVTVQTMTNTPTSDAEATIAQIRRCEEAGVDIIRVSCPDVASTAALRQIVRESRVPIVADIHFHYKRALEAADAGAACLRINPGNIGSEERVKEVIAAARSNGCAIRIGVNAGSLEKDLLEKYGEPCPEALVESALDHIRILEDHGFQNYKVAVKASDLFLAVAAYHQLAEAVDCPLHLGITEAGGLIGGTVKSAIGMGSLLWAGIGDTIRVSLSAEPEEEVRVGYELLKSLGIRNRGVRVVSCPSCARQGFDVIRTVQALEERLQHIRTPMSLSVLGCVVNGPGEARETDIGITGGGAGKHMVYLSGVTDHHVEDAAMIEHIVRLVEAKAAEIEAGISQTADAA
jgi:(E)-4-hydroxy-3-methylbut-2-enyl-diphosphate synthase